MPYKDVEKRRETSRNACRKWRAGNPNAAATASRSWDRRNPKKVAFTSKRANAKKDGIPFDLRFEEVEFPEVCPVLGIKLIYEMGRKAAQPDSPSFDRIDPTKGYVAGNVIIVSHLANTVKNNATPDELMKIARFYAGLKTDITLPTTSLCETVVKGGLSCS